MTLPSPLDQLSSDQQRVVEQTLEPLHFEPNERIFAEGGTADACYIVDRGVVRIQLDREELDSDAVIGFQDAGTVLGEIALLDRGPRSASAYAHEAVDARRLDAAALDRLIRVDPRVGATLLQAMGHAAARKLRSSTEKVAEATFVQSDPAAEAMVQRALAAQVDFAGFDEERVDALLFDLARSIAEQARSLAEATVEETRVGNVRDKTRKNQVASFGVFRTLVGRAGSGTIAVDEERQVREIASPVGVIFGLVPVTAPVATMIFKTLVALKGRNALILSPNRRALGVSNRTGEILRGILRKHGAPEHLVQWVRERNSRKRTGYFMSHPGVALVLATGGRSMVEAAYRSGTPALGVGPGNAPTLVSAQADLAHAARSVVMSKSFDNGLICAGESNLIVEDGVYERFVAELERHGAAVLDEQEVHAFAAAAIDPRRDTLRMIVLGQSAATIAEVVGIKRPYPIRALVIPTERAAPDNALAREKMAPIMGLFRVADQERGFALARALLELDGIGHTASIFTPDERVAVRFGEEMPASRIFWNSPTVQGTIGITSGLVPSLTLGCGTFAGNSTTDSVTFENLRNVKRLASYQEDRGALVDYVEHVNPAYAMQIQAAGLDATEREGQGCIVRDSRGREFLDCVGGFGVMSLGHRHPRVVEAVRAQLETLPLSSKVFFNEQTARLARRLAELTPGALQLSFFCNSGAEAAEAALKLARASTGRPGIVATEGAFHGKTLGALSASGRDAFKQPFGPLLPGFSHVPFGSVEAMAEAIDDDTAAVIVEPIQGEGGVIVPPQGYLRGLRELCSERGVLLILDEVQTGLGRTGAMFACDHEDVAPDILMLAKALGGGVMPIGAVVGNEAVWRPFEDSALIHSSTFGGNPLACAAALATLDVLQEERLPERAAEMGSRMLEALQTLQVRHPTTIAEVRGKGLLIGIELSHEDLAAFAIAELAERDMLIAYTLNQPRVLRFEPPLILSDLEAERALTTLAEALAATEARGRSMRLL